MKPLPQCDLTAIRGFLHTLPITAHAQLSYGGAIEHFQRFVRAQAAGQSFTPSHVRSWLQQQARRCALDTVHNQARWVDRFLQWRQGSGGSSNNPFAELRHRYGVRAMSKIVNALLSKNYRSALEKLRPLPRYGSFLGPQMQADVHRKRALGYRYDGQELRYLHFDRFLQTRSDLSGEPISKIVAAWSRCGSSPRHALDAHQCGRNLSKALQRLDPNLPLLPIDTALRRRVIAQERRPYIYSEAQIQQLLRAAQNYPSPLAPWRPLMLYTMVVLTYCAGLRIGELVRLTLGDVHLEDESIEIRNTKFFKSRRLPLAPGVMRVLKDYLAARERLGAPRTAQSGLFWSPRRRQACGYGLVDAYLIDVIRRAGLKPQQGRGGPRVHDLRHSFVLHRMLAWYRAGINPQAHLPYLATYLGHRDISSTLAYLTQTQELMREANERFRQWAAPVMNDSGVQP